MQIKILFDSLALDDRFSTGWGVSYLIDGRILFDTAEKAWPLFSNMEIMKVEISKIEEVFISHDHWDHTGGLKDILEEKSGLKVYGCPGFSREFKQIVRSGRGRLKEIKKFTKLGRNIYSSGAIEADYGGKTIWEQSLVLKTANGVMILTGCAHPGIIKIVETVRASIDGNIYLVLGGFHLLDKDQRTINLIVNKFKQLGVKKAAASHCSGRKAIEMFRKEYSDNFIEVKAGQVIEV